MKIRKPIIYWDACIFIALITSEDRPNKEMDGVYHCKERIMKGEVHLIAAREPLFEEVQLRELESAENFRQLMMRKGISLPSIDFRIDRIAKELQDYYSGVGSRPLGEKDSLHLATAIQYKADYFYTFDSGKKKRTLNLLAISGLLAGKYPLVICKPPIPSQFILPPVPAIKMEE